MHDVTGFYLCKQPLHGDASIGRRRARISLNQARKPEGRVCTGHVAVLDCQSGDARVMHAYPATNRKALQTQGFSLAGL